MSEIKCILNCGNLTVENSDYCAMCKPVEKPRKKDAHVQLSKRFAKALLVKDLVVFTSLETGFVPSAKEMPEKGHNPQFGKKPFCECSSFTFGFSADPHFACYHILAARYRLLETVSEDTRKSLEEVWQ